jgi:hypothetical protein
MPNALSSDISYTPVPSWAVLGRDDHAQFWPLAALSYSDARKDHLVTPNPSKEGKASLKPDEHLLCYDFLYYVSAGPHVSVPLSVVVLLLRKVCRRSSMSVITALHGTTLYPSCDSQPKSSMLRRNSSGRPLGCKIMNLYDRYVLAYSTTYAVDRHLCSTLLCMSDTVTFSGDAAMCRRTNA